MAAGGKRILSELAAAAVLAAALALFLAVRSRDGGWEAWNDYGRWTISADRAVVRTERQGLDCASGHRVRVDTSKPGVALLRFESRPLESDEGCDASMVCTVAGTFACGVTITLPAPVPVGWTVRSVCQPERTPYAATVPGGGQVTLRPGGGGAPPVVCSPVPESGGG